MKFSNERLSNKELSNKTFSHIAVVLVAFFCAGSAFAQGSTGTAGEPDPVQVAFKTFRNYLTSYDKKHVGKKMVVSDIAASAVEFGELKDMLKQPKTEDEVVIFTSVELAERLRAHLSAPQKRARIVFTLVEARQKAKASLVAFATRIEGLNEDGSVAWFETGPPPPQLKFDLSSRLGEATLTMKFVATKVDRS